MNRISKVILAAVAIAALATPAMATDKLIVKHTSGADAFKVDDNGKITEFTSDAGTTNELEYARYERSSTATPAVGLGAKSSTLLKVGASSIVAQEQVLKWKSVSAGVESADYIIRNYSLGALRDVLLISAQPMFYRYLGTGTFNGVQAAGQIILKKGLATMQDGVGPRLAFQTDDNTGTQLVVGGLAFPTDLTNSRSSLVFNVKGGVSDPFGTTEALRVTYDGKLGLGTTDPKSKLHIANLPVYADNATAKAAFGGAPGALGAIYTDGVGNVKIVY